MEKLFDPMEQAFYCPYGAPNNIFLKTHYLPIGTLDPKHAPCSSSG
jgi:hypothetical protein